jgi:hypothetical protein
MAPAILACAVAPALALHARGSHVHVHVCGLEYLLFTSACGMCTCCAFVPVSCLAARAGAVLEASLPARRAVLRHGPGVHAHDHGGLFCSLAKGARRRADNKLLRQARRGSIRGKYSKAVWRCCRARSRKSGGRGFELRVSPEVGNTRRRWVRAAKKT